MGGDSERVVPRLGEVRSGNHFKKPLPDEGGVDRGLRRVAGLSTRLPLALLLAGEAWRLLLLAVAMDESRMAQARVMASKEDCARF